MKFDFKKIQELASQVPDLITKGQQVVATVQTVTETFRPRGTSGGKSSLLPEIKDSEEEISLPEEEVMECEPNESERLELAITGIGYLKVPGRCDSNDWRDGPSG